MSDFVRFDRKDIQTIIGTIDELADPKDRNEQEIIVYNKACQILALMQSSEEKDRPSLYRDPESGRLSILAGSMTSEPVPYNGVARISNFFAVTDYFECVFPTNVLLRFLHVNPADRQDWLARKVVSVSKSAIANVRRPRWKRSEAEQLEIESALK